MFVAYRGLSVILFAPIAALGAVFLTDPHAVPAAFTSLFMDKMVGFARLYYPVFLLGAPAAPNIRLCRFSARRERARSSADAVRLLRGDERLRRHWLCRGDRHCDRSTLENSATAGWRN
jgi:hypothetical protein